MICSIAALLAAMGICLEYGAVPEWFSLLLFILVFILYYQLINNIWRILAWVRSKLPMNLIEQYSLRLPSFLLLGGTGQLGLTLRQLIDESFITVLLAWMLIFCITSS